MLHQFKLQCENYSLVHLYVEFILLTNMVKTVHNMPSQIILDIDSVKIL